MSHLLVTNSTPKPLLGLSDPFFHYYSARTLSCWSQVPMWIHSIIQLTAQFAQHLGQNAGSCREQEHSDKLKKDMCPVWQEDCWALWLLQGKGIKWEGLEKQSESWNRNHRIAKTLKIGLGLHLNSGLQSRSIIIKSTFLFLREEWTRYACPVTFGIILVSWTIELLHDKQTN